MFLAEIPYPEIDPVLFTIGPLKIKWYGLMFVAGFLVGNALLKRLSTQKRLPVDHDGVNDLLVALMVGVIVGGRIGYVLFYQFEKYAQEPADIVKIWQGGLSFHGGLVGAFLAALWFSRRRRVSLLRLMDAIGVCATPGILFVRCANFINGELWGRTTDVPWAMVFPTGGEVPRHPSQLYEGLLEGALLFCVLWFNRDRAMLRPAGRLASAFLIGYAALRFFIEFFREPDSQLGFVLGPLSMGQLLSLGMLVFGLVVFRVSGRRPAPGSP